MGLRHMPSVRVGESRRNGFEGSRMNSRNPTPSIACTASTRALSAGGRFCPNTATAAPNRVRMNTHRSIEPSWLLHTPDNLYSSGLVLFELAVTLASEKSDTA